MNETAAYLGHVASRLQDLLGEELVGVYAGGSFALGGYDPRRSDLDVAAVCRGPRSVESKVEIGGALRHESLPCPARGLELVVYTEAVVREQTLAAGYELDLNSGRAMPFRLSVAPDDAARHWYVIDRAIIRERGLTLEGPPAREVFAPFERETLLTMLSESVAWHTANADARLDDTVLNGCRAWRYVEERVWSSKVEAGSWARQRAGDPELISEALAARLGNERLDAERVAAFTRRVQRRLKDAGARMGRAPS
ncbi:MAG: DUF4111 domain-containing protein [Actinobacteria bacterium]|nr:DUF4111 domain-containing protein [Actinomycetota bacterium]